MRHSALKWGAAMAGLAGAGAAAAVVQKRQAARRAPETPNDYRNTERGRNQKNAKGIYYSSGNYEAFARPEKPAGVNDKNAYIVGSGLAALAAACFLVRDGQMPGDHIHILEAMDIAGGACDGIQDPTRGYIMRGGREMENHFECLWDLFRSIPSLETPGASVLDEFYWLNKHDPNYSLCRATVNRGQDAHTDGKFNLSQKACMEIVKLFMTKDEDLYDKTIEDVFDDEVFNSTFWLYWRTMFAFENWHSALEMKLYFQRFIHHIAGLPDFSALKFTRYNQYESLILPMQKYLEQAGVDFQFGTEVTNVLFDIREGKKVATAIECKVHGTEKGILLTENDLVFVTNGSCTEGTIYGDQDHAPNGDAEVRTSGCWNLWKNIAKQDPAFGHPEKVLLRCGQDQLGIGHHHDAGRQNPALYHQHLPAGSPQRPGGHRRHRQLPGLRLAAQLDHQPPGTVQRPGPRKGLCLGVRPLHRCAGQLRQKAHAGMHRPRNHRGMALPPGCAGSGHSGTGRLQCGLCAHHDALYHGLLHAPCQGGPPRRHPRRLRELCLPGQFAETPRDTVFTTEYSVRTAMEAVYGLLGVDRGVPEVWGSVYDIRALLDSSVCLMDGRSPLEMELPGPLNLLKKPLCKAAKGTVVEKLLRDHGILRDTQ